MIKIRKAIIIGASFSGKSTIVEYIRNNYPKILVKEMDEMIIKKNKGEWPKNKRQLKEILIPLVIDEILNIDKDILFFTSYISPEKIVEAKEKKFKIIQLYITNKQIKKRNIANDMKREKEAIININEYQKYLQKKYLNLIDLQISANQDVEKISNKLVDLGNK